MGLRLGGRFWARGLFVKENALAFSIQIIELFITYRPEEQADGDTKEK